MKRGELHLTELGRMVTDPKTEASARAQAFLNEPIRAEMELEIRKEAAN
jgi:hypothetical protein